MTHAPSICSNHPYVANPPGQYGHVLARPWVEVIATYNGLSHKVWCLVDTGADNTLLDLGTAATFGVNHLALPQINITLSDGTTSVSSYGELANVSLQFAGTQVPGPGMPGGVTVLLGNVAVPLLGRSALLQEPGSPASVFDASQWLHT